MKKLFLLIGLLMPILLFSQIELSQDQKDRLLYIATPSKLQEWADNKLHNSEMDSVINARDIQIKFLKDKIELLKDEYTATLLEIAKAGKESKKAKDELNEVNDEIIKRSGWKGLHLFIGGKMERFDYEMFGFDCELLYESKELRYGLYGETKYDEIIDKNTFSYGVKVKYMIF